MTTRKGESKKASAETSSPDRDTFDRLLSELKDGIHRLTPDYAKEGITEYRRARESGARRQEMQTRLADLRALSRNRKERDLILMAANAQSQLALVGVRLGALDDPGFDAWVPYCEACRFLGVMQGLSNVVTADAIGSEGGKRRSERYVEKERALKELFAQWEAGKLILPNAREGTHRLEDFDEHAATKLDVSERWVSGRRAKWRKIRK